MKRVLHTILCLLLFHSAFSNNDSLIVFSLLEQAKKTEFNDSSLHYANEAMSYSTEHKYLDGVLTVAKFFGNQYAQTGELEKSVELYQKIISENKFDYKQLSTAYNQLGIYHVYMGHYDSTEVCFLKALKMRTQLNDSIGMGASLNNLGNVVMSKGDYDKATSYYIKALKIREQIQDNAGIASSTNNLGMIFYKQRNYKEAIKYYHQALNINQQQKVLDKEILIFINLGNIYDEMMLLDSSQYYYKVATEKADDFGNLRLISMAYGNLGVTQHQLKNYALAKYYIRKALKIRIESEDIEGQAILYNNLGSVYVATEKYDSAIFYFNESLRFSKEISYLETTRDNYLGLTDAYEKSNQLKKAFISHQLYAATKDSMLNEATQEQIAELKTQYETTKKEKEIAKQKVKITEQQQQTQQRKNMQFGLMILVVFIVVVSAFIYKNQKQKQLQLLEENKLKDEIAQVKIQNELHEERLRISRDLHENIGSQLTYIISSVDNMSHIFDAVDEKIKGKMVDVSNFTSATITQLRDTIWALNKDEISFEDLKVRLYNYIKNAQLAQEQTKFDFYADLDSDIQLNSIQGVSIYRIVQEAINNSMKYAAATKVLLNISETTEHIMLKIVDDGVGFNMAEIQLGNGLENMKNRAQAINALFDIISEPTKGTEIILTLPKTSLN